MTTEHEKQWKPIHELPDDVSASLQRWLSIEDSLTEQCKQQGLFEVQLLDEKWGTADKEEKHLLEIHPSERCWQRDVILWLNHKPIIIAHSLIPESLLAEPEAGQLCELGNRPLGEVIFGELKGERENLMFMTTVLDGIELYVRRSTVKIKNKKLLINEVFLPAIEDFI